MPIAFAAAFAGALGATIGSFLNVIVYRLPRRESLVSPRLALPGLRDRDQALRQRAGARVADAARALPELQDIDLAPVPDRRGADRRAGRDRGADQPLGRPIVLGLVLVAVLVPVALIDLEHRIIPNKITLPAAIAAVAIGVALDLRGVPEQLIAGAGAGGFLLVFALAYPRGMGMGDVKLAAVLGLFLGRSVAVAILVAVFAARWWAWS